MARPVESASLEPPAMHAVGPGGKRQMAGAIVRVADAGHRDGMNARGLAPFYGIVAARRPIRGAILVSQKCT
jgi:hypothetical protein